MYACMKQLINHLICLFRGHIYYDIYYDCICGRCGKHMYDAPVSSAKKFFMRIVCLCKGHKWKYKKEKQPNFRGLLCFWTEYYKCIRCGKTKDVI